MAGLGGVPPGYIAEEGDPRLPHPDYPQSLLRKLHDPNVSFEEYIHYASITRAEERADYASGVQGEENGFFKRFRKTGATFESATTDASTAHKRPLDDEKLALEKTGTMKTGGSNSPTNASRAIVSTDEWEQASRAARTASWGAVFCKTDLMVKRCFG